MYSSSFLHIIIFSCFLDHHNEGMIACPEFIKSMIAMGITEHEKEMRERIIIHRKEEEQLKLLEKKKEEELILKNSTEYSRTFSEEDMENALRMLTEAARKYVTIIVLIILFFIFNFLHFWFFIFGFILSFSLFLTLSISHSLSLSHTLPPSLTLPPLPRHTRYDKNMPGQPMLNGFDNILFMEPHVFKDQMQRAFRLKITPQETGALLEYFNAV